MLSLTEAQFQEMRACAEKVGYHSAVIDVLMVIKHSGERISEGLVERIGHLSYTVKQ